MCTNEEALSIDDLLLDPSSSEPQEIATSLLSDEKIITRLTHKYHGPLLSVRTFILNHERKSVEAELKSTIDDFQSFGNGHEEEPLNGFAEFRDTLLEEVGDLLFSPEDGQDMDSSNLYKSWVDVYMHTLFRLRPDLRRDPQRFIAYIRIDLLDAGLGNGESVEKRIGDIKFLIVKEAISHIMRKNNFTPSRADWAIFNPRGYNSHEASSFLINDLVDNGVVDRTARGDSFTKSVIASYFALFRRFNGVRIESVDNSIISSNWNNWQKSNQDFIEFMNMWSDYRRLFGKFQTVLSKISSIKRLKGDLDIALVPSGPYVLAAWLDFYAMVKFFRENMQKGNVDSDALIRGLMVEFDKEGILNDNLTYIERVLRAKSMVYGEIVAAWQ